MNCGGAGGPVGAGGPPPLGPEAPLAGAGGPSGPVGAGHPPIGAAPSFLKCHNPTIATHSPSDQ